MRIPEISFFDIFFLFKCKIALLCKKQGVISHLSLLEHVMVSPLFVLLIRQGDFFYLQHFISSCWWYKEKNFNF